ncbi:MAG: hypothetical protein K9M51_03205 [Candidatus Gracilibacteria bacterium]|nr:hypothetical protein [Candidatus Gracilibacteria bacterium]
MNFWAHSSHKKSGFSLIGALLLIVGVSVMTTTSLLLFQSYFHKIRDAQRFDAVKSIALMLKVDATKQWHNGRYLYDAHQLDALFRNNDTRPPIAKEDIAYFVLTSNTTNTGEGEDDQFVVVTWGERANSKTTGKEGLILAGTEAAVKRLQNAAVPPQRDHFTLADTKAAQVARTNVILAFSSSEMRNGGTLRYSIIDEKGRVRTLSDLGKIGEVPLSPPDCGSYSGAQDSTGARGQTACLRAECIWNEGPLAECTVPGA